MRNNSRLPATIISGIYLFGPMLITTADFDQAPAATDSYVTQALLGKGGPDEVYVVKPKFREQANDRYGKILLPLNAYYTPFDMADEQEPPVPIVKVLNYMKVSNTTWPVDTPDVSSEYGWRTPPCNGCSADHKGVDFVPGYNTPVYAVTDGMIVEMGSTSGYGTYIVIDHLVTNNEGELEEWQTLYAHMIRDSVPDGLIIGSVVRTGEEIGRVGSTGVSTGPHLHFELIVNGEHVDPFPLLGTHQILTFEEGELPDYQYSGELIKTEATVVGYE